MTVKVNPQGALLDLKLDADALDLEPTQLAALVLATARTASEKVARLAPKARVVKAFNTIGTAVMENPIFDGQRAFLPVAADDDEAKRIVLDLARELGFDAVDFGPLINARYLESLAMIWIQLAYPLGHGKDFAFVTVGR